MYGDEALSAEIALVGWGDTVRALRTLAPDVLRETYRELEGTAIDLASKAQALGGTFIEPGAYIVKRGGGSRGKIGDTRLKEKAAFGYRTVVSKGSRRAAIFEFAGTKNPRGKTPQGARMIEMINRRYGLPGRIIWAAYDANKDAYMARAKAAIGRAETVCRERIEAAGDEITFS